MTNTPLFFSKADADDFAGISWLGDVNAERNDWQTRFNRSDGETGLQIKQLDELLAGGQLKTATHRRLTLKRDALVVQRQAIAQLLARYQFSNSDTELGTYTAMKTPVPATQGLMSYYPNIHRDWCWGEIENQQSLKAVIDAAKGKSLGRLLVLGSGAGRLAYDLHQSGECTATLALDFNPLLTCIGHELSAGHELTLPEFPIAPISIEDVARLRLLKAPSATNSGLKFVVGDAFTAPLIDHSFDTVLTPWFTDIVEVPMSQLCARIHSLLEPQGRWINFGSHAIQRADERECFSVEESIEQISQQGFSKPQVYESAVAYMNSPASRHGRQELVVTWVCHAQSDKKQSINTSTANANLKASLWLSNTQLSVPQTDAFQLQAMSTKIHAYVMSLIDGKRSIEDIARVLDKQNIMPMNEAVPSVQRFITTMWEESQQPRKPNSI